MAELIPPRRDETLTGDGIPTLRFSEYLEGLARNVNASTSESELVDVAASPAQLASVIKQLRDLELQQDTGSAAAISQIFKRLSDIELQTDNTAMLATIIKRLNDLELTQEPQSTAAVNAAIKSTFDRRYALLVG